MTLRKSQVQVASQMKVSSIKLFRFSYKNLSVFSFNFMRRSLSGTYDNPMHSVNLQIQYQNEHHQASHHIDLIAAVLLAVGRYNLSFTH